MSASTTPASTRVHGFIARSARVAVLLRRGPSKHVRMIRWDLSDDTLERGQWLSGRVYPERSGLSPDGQLFVYFAGKFRADVDTFTAICRPPYFTALGFWPSSGTWGGGGVFVSDREVALGINVPELNDCETFPADFVVTGPHRLGGPPGVLEGWALVQEGEHAADPTMWRSYDPPQIFARTNPSDAAVTLERHLLGIHEVNGPWHVRAFRTVRTMRSRDEVSELGRLSWADWDHNGDLLFARGGRVMRRPLKAVRGGDAPDVLVADLSDDVFTNIPPPPEARRWPRR